MDLFVNFKDAEKNGMTKIEYIAKKQTVKIRIKRRLVEQTIFIEVHGVEDSKIINRNIILRNYKFSVNGNCIIFEKSDEPDDSLYLLILAGKEEHIPFFKFKDFYGQFLLKCHIDCSDYVGLWFVHKNFIIELKESLTFGMCVPIVDEWRNERIKDAPEKYIGYFYRFTKKKVEDENGVLTTTWSFRRINNKKKESEVLYRPIIPRM